MTLDSLFPRVVAEWGKLTGWCPLEKAIDLAAIVVALRPKVVIETGVWGGKSAIPMALACQAIEAGTVIGIDPWSQEASTEGYNGANAAWWGQQDHEKVYQDFLGHVTRLNLGSHMVVRRMKSETAEVPTVIDVCHLDAQHSDMCSREIDRFVPNLRMGGIVILDDLSWNNEGDLPIVRAVDKLLKLGFVELHRRKQPNGEWGIFQKVGRGPGRPRK